MARADVGETEAGDNGHGTPTDSDTWKEPSDYRLQMRNKTRECRIKNDDGEARSREKKSKEMMMK